MSSEHTRAATAAPSPGAARSRRGGGRARRLALAATVAGALAATLAAAAGAAGPTEPTAATQCGSKPIKIALISLEPNSYDQAIEKGMRGYLAPCKNVSVNDFNATDALTEYNTIQNVTTLGTYKGIAFLPLDATSVIPAMKKAIAAGIQVVNFNNPVGNNYTSASVNVPGEAGSVLEPQYQRGIWLAELAGAACKGVSDCQIGYIAGDATAAEDPLKAGFDLEMKKFPNMHVVAYSENGGYLASPAETVAQDFLTAHPGLNVITGSGDQMMVGAALAIKAAGDEGKIKIIGLGGSVIAVNAIKAGTWYGTVITQPLDMGRLTAWILLSHILDPKLAPQGVNPFTYTHRSPLLTKQNLASSHFVPQWAGS